MVYTGEVPGKEFHHLLCIRTETLFWLGYKFWWELFIRVLEECRRAKGDLECSFYNAERRKKPVTCTPMVWYLIIIGSLLFTLFSFSTLLFALYRMNHLPHAYAPYDPTRENASTMPIRLAQLKSAALEPEVEIQGTAGTLRAAWTQTVMERYDQPKNVKDYLQKFLVFAFKTRDISYS